MWFMITMENLLKLYDLKNLDEKQFAFIANLYNILTDDDPHLQVKVFPSPTILVDKEVNISKLEYVVRTLVRNYHILGYKSLDFRLRFSSNEDEENLWEYLIWFIRFFSLLEDSELSGNKEVKKMGGYAKKILRSKYCPHSFDLNDYTDLHFYHTIHLY